MFSLSGKTMDHASFNEDSIENHRLLRLLPHRWGFSQLDYDPNQLRQAPC